MTNAEKVFNENKEYREYVLRYANLFQNQHKTIAQILDEVIIKDMAEYYQHKNDGKVGV